MKKRINLMMILQNRIVSLGAINFIVIIVSSLIWSNSFATIANAQSVAAKYGSECNSMYWNVGCVGSRRN